VENRKIVHIDMDAFYASVEQRDCPKYQGQPVVVGGAPGKRGVVAACSYEARKFGIHSAMPSSTAFRLCPQAVFLSPRFDAYRQVSLVILEIFQSFTDRVEPLSLDEAYLDVTNCGRFKGSATRIAKVIKQRIKEVTGLTASAGVSYNKFLAKIASDMDKPDGLYVITPEQGEAFIEKLPIGKFFGVGKAIETKMWALNIHTGLDLKRWSLLDLQDNFGKAGDYFFYIARGIDNRPVISQRLRKSLGSEMTFEQDISDRANMLASLNGIAEKVTELLKKKGLYARTITIKVKYDNFDQVTRSKTMDTNFNDTDTILPVLPQLLFKTEAGDRKVRLLGVTVSNLSTDRSKPGYKQSDLSF